jgi:glycosyltransferase involved in cell wall biosynthesis
MEVVAAAAGTQTENLGPDGPERSVTSKKIVVLSGFRIFPVSTGGQVRTSSIARVLARMGYEVLLYSLAGRRTDYSFPRGRSYRIDPIEPRLTEETHLGVGYGLMQMVVRHLDQPRYWQFHLLKRGIVPGRLKSALRAADAILSDFSFCPPVPGPWSSKPWYLISHQLEYRLLEQASASQSRFAARMCEVERAAPRRYTDIFACAEEDRDFFRAHDPTGRLAVPIISCGVDPAAYVAPPGSRERIRGELGLGDDDKLLIFSGSGFRPNMEALQRLKEFARAEADFLNRERLHILVLGSMEPVAYRRGALIATGRVPDVVPYFAAGDAGLNPITSGTGANVKLFEYLAARLPVISTPFGVRGSDLQPETDFLPYVPEDPKTALLRFARERTAGEWRAHAEDVWQRHRVTSDIGESVRAALTQVIGFPALG